MEQKYGAELSDSALERVAGGISTMSTNYTYSPTGPATAGPAGGSSCAAGKTKKDEFVDENIWALLVAAGTLDKYSDDLREYNMKYGEWKRVYDLDPIHLAPPPPPPNPYDYL